MASSPKKWEGILRELSITSQLEHLRPHIKKHALFPRGVNPDSAPILYEYLAKLARVWNLHHKRGFWREHREMNDMVDVLYDHLVEHVGSVTTPVAASKPKASASTDTLSTLPTGSVASQSPFVSPRGTSDGNSKSLPKYGIGDVFGTRGSYMDGSIYLSRVRLRQLVRAH